MPIWLKFEGLGAVSTMRLLFDVESFEFDPSVALACFAKVRPRVKEEEVESSVLPFLGG